jgi:hypothetical protein
VSPVLLRPLWVVGHVLVAVLVTTFGALAWWQFDRARGGNALSIGYTCEWPAFAVFTVGVWLWLCRDAVHPRGDAPTAPALVDPDRVPDHLVVPVRETFVPVITMDDDPELVEYNRMLQRLHREKQS